MAQVFGPDTFTVGADTNIDAYPAGDADYAYTEGSGTDLTVNAANDRVQTASLETNKYARLIDAAAPTGDQEEIADCQASATGGDAVGRCLVRGGAVGNHCYICDVNIAAANELEIYRLDAGSASLVASSDRGLTGDAMRRMRLRATGAGARVAIVQQADDTRPLLFVDTTANRKTSGTPGLSLYNVTANAAFVDNLSVDDLAATAFQARCGTITIGSGAAGTTYREEGLGFQPKVLILWWTRRNGNVNAAGDADLSSGFGVVVGTADRRCVAWSDDHAATTMSADSYHSDAACVATLVVTSGAVDGLADLSSLDADGFTLIVDDAFAAAVSVNYLALGGADLTNMATGVFNEPGATGNHNEGALAFTPDCVIFLSAGIGAAAPGGAAHGQCMVGAATSSTARGVTSILQRDAVLDSDTYRYSLSSECIALMATGTGATDYREDFVAFISGGFTLNAIERTAGARRVHYLALKGGSFRVGGLTTRTDGNDIAVTGLASRPRGVFFASACAAESTADTPVAQSLFSMGAFDSQSAIDPARNRVARCTKGEDASAASDCGDIMRFDAVYAKALVTTSAVDALMDVKSVEATGFTCVMDDTEPTVGSFVWWLAFGDAVAAGGGSDDLGNPIFRSRMRQW